MAERKLELNLEKTIIVSYDDDLRRTDRQDVKFNFLTWNAQKKGSSSNTLFFDRFFNNVDFYF